MNRKRLVEVAAGREKADLVLKNADVVNVFTKEVLRADVALADGWIAGLGSYVGKEERDCTGLVLCPGFIDAHLHIESAMVPPAELVRSVLPSGTTTLVADPHEIVNVCGAEGVAFMLQASENLPCNIYVMLPSSVPATAFETAGASFTAGDMEAFLQHPRVLGLGEVMCYPDVVAGRGEIYEKVSLFEKRPIDGHAPGLSGAALQAYAAAGVRTEHEATHFAEALEKARAGFAILVREGSAAHNLMALVQGLVAEGIPTERFLFCTDDKHLDDTRRDGHIRWNVKMAVDAGLPAVEAIRMASWNTAQVYGFSELGAVAAGYRADLVLLKDLKTIEVVEVYKDGVPAKEALCAMRPGQPVQASVLQSVHLPKLDESRLQLAVQGDTDVIQLVPYQLETEHLREAVPQAGGYFAPNRVYNKLCVVERHGKSGNVAVAPLKGFGLTGGAIASTVAHDSHNILAAGDSDADLLLAIRRLEAIGGGYVLVQNGRVEGEVPLALAGLMSTLPAEEVQAQVGDIIRLSHSMGIPGHVDPFITLSFLALPVIPSLRLTDKGLFDVEKFALLQR